MSAPRSAALLLLLAAVLNADSTAATADRHNFTQIGDITFQHASFVAVERVNDHDILLATSFAPFGAGQVAHLNLSTAEWPNPQLTVFPCDFKWPNKVSYAPIGLLPDVDAIVVPDGFLVPGKSTGSISFITRPFSKNPECVKISTDKNGYFYHMVIWRDMNGDGRQDILTARVNKPTIGKSTGELVWFEQPAENPISNVPWKEHVITQGPEVIFAIVNQSDFSGSADEADSVYYIAAAQYFNPKVALYQLNQNNSFVQSFIIDDKCGATEDIHVIDLDGDGRKELLVNTHLSGTGGAVYSYQFPISPVGPFQRRTLADGFPVTEPGPDQASPGFLTPYVLSTTQKQPSILVAGDGSRAAYDLVLDTTSSTYTKTTITSVKGVIGVIAAQTNKAGVLTTAFVPDYDQGHIFVYNASSE
eukprot:m.150411 g.150411  ORF g.150411 m.150411 type:complete len:418 (+) comp16175_c2_seq6:146-1399(+)